MAKAKGNPDKVNPRMALEALDKAKGDRRKAYSMYILLHYRSTGSLVADCDNKDLQAFYDKYFAQEES